MIVRAIGLLLIAAWSLLASGCNTMRGFGQDIDALGEAIQRKAR